jgi:cytochrome c oxidase subunit 2
VRVVAHEWWWEIQYPNEVPSRTVTTANELHLPTGRPIQVELSASETDWHRSGCVLDLMGQQAAISAAGAAVNLFIEADDLLTSRPLGDCGSPRMDLLVVAESPHTFALWRTHQLAPATVPDRDPPRQGRQLFLSSSCVMCHTVRGTIAAGTAGPDLTHVATRHFLGAGVRMRLLDTLAQWITHPQRLKPGTRMPATALPPRDLDLLVSYLDSLR